LYKQQKAEITPDNLIRIMPAKGEMPLYNRFTAEESQLLSSGFQHKLLT
jgi:hypothetical protein